MDTKESAEAMLATLPLDKSKPVLVEDVVGDGITGVLGAARRRFHYPNGMVEIDAEPSKAQLEHLSKQLPIADKDRAAAAQILTADVITAEPIK
jgi:hypothetical protein